jgi:hypothetical protein
LPCLRYREIYEELRKSRMKVRPTQAEQERERKLTQALMSPDQASEKCPKFNISLDALLTKARRRDIPDEGVIAVVENATDRVGLIRALKLARLSLIDIADCTGVSRETIRKIVGPGAPRAAELSRPKPMQTIEEIRREIWQEAIRDPSWWLNDSLSREKIIERLKRCNYRGSQIKAGLLNLIWRPKAEIILVVAFEIPVEQHRQWINERLAERNSYTDILKIINLLQLTGRRAYSRQPLKTRI